MIPADIRLYTWVDVEEVLLQVQQKNDWPGWLVWARAYWDGLTLGIRPETQPEALGWLAEKFDPRFQGENGQASILLESIEDTPRQLNILFEETTETPPKPRLLPRLKLPSVLWPPDEPVSPTVFSSDLPPVVAFHSFKGGVGRTLHALALALSLSQEGGEKSHILLVDGDLEAPGLTWLLRERFPNLPISLIDLLALVHGDPDPKAQESIKLVAKQVENLFLDGIYVLPAFRSSTQFTYLEVKPEHITQGVENQFILTTILAQLGRLLGVRAVIVDLRAGLSELATGLLLDPRVYRVLVTTLSTQSIEGTRQVLQLLGSLAPARQEEDPTPALVISQVPSEYQQQEALLATFEEQLLEAAEAFLADEQDEVTLGLPRVISYFDQGLTVLPQNWDAVTKLLRQRDIVENMSSITAWLPGNSFIDSKSVPRNVEELKRKRIELTQFTESLVYAETGNVADFLSIPPLSHLASDFRVKVPIAVIIGAKGAGKTYTFLQVVRRENWRAFVEATGVTEEAIEAYVSPILNSKNLTETANLIVQQTKQKTADALDFAPPLNSQEILDYLRDSLQEDLHEGQWRSRWLNVIAWGMGFNVNSEDAGRNLAHYLRERKKFVLVIFDGLEDLFQDLPSNEYQQIALRALLQDVPEWLEQQPGRPMGIVVFARQDMVLNAIKQNAAQLMARYEPYALKWNSEQALRLVAWIVSKAPIDFQISQLEEKREADLVDELEPLWGRKLGSERSKETRSAEWIIAALSDLNGQIQARDLVRFLSKAAEGSQANTYWNERLLVPTAIRNAIKNCSQEKIEEIGIENSRLGNILSKLRELPEPDKRIPFTRDQASLDVDELRTLEANGVILREGEEYYMPEIFRLGLDFKLASGARPRVLTLSRRIRRQSG